MKRLGSNLLLCVASILVTLVCAEIALRLSGELYVRFRLGWSPSRHRGRSVRILCAGDSFTFGLGAPKGWSYPEQIRKRLDETHPEEYAVFNEGKPGLNSSQLLDRMPSLMRKYLPDIVIVMIGSNNGNQLIGSNYYLFATRPRSIGKRWGFALARLLSSTRLYKLTQAALRGIAAHRRRWSPDGNPHRNVRSRFMELYLLEKKRFRLDRAEEAIRRHLEVHPGDAMARMYLAETLSIRAQKEGKGSLEEALKEVEKVLAFHPPYNAAQQLCQSIQRKLGLLPPLDWRAHERLLAYDLRGIVRVIVHYRARPILMNYPGWDTGVPKTVCRNLPCGYVDLYARVKSFLKTHEALDFFSGDHRASIEEGHPNRTGYGVIAEEVMKAVIKP